MTFKPSIYKGSTTMFILVAGLLATLTGCVSYDRPRAGSVYLEEPEINTITVVQDDYVYYPGYEVYYSRSRNQYAYREGRRWVSRPAPRGVSVDVLLASPSVNMNFHDSPAQHHAAVVRQYPKNWTPHPSTQGRGESHNDSKRDGRGKHDGR
jgi:hypothetical protein